MTFAADGGSESLPTGSKYQSPNVYYEPGNSASAMYLHQVKHLGGTWSYSPHTFLNLEGYSNVAFADGSVRAVLVRFIAQPHANTYPAWDDVIFDPYQPQQHW